MMEMLAISTHQKIERHLQRPRNRCQGMRGAAPPAGFKVRHVALTQVRPGPQFKLRHIPPLAEDTDRVVVRGQSIHDGFRQHDLVSRRNRGARLAYDAGGSCIFALGQRQQPLILGLRQNREFLTAGGLDELNLCHDHPSIINLTTISDSGDDDRIAFGVEDDAPVADAQSGSGAPLETLHIALPGLCEGQELGIEAPTHVRGELESLTRGRGRKGDLHGENIAYRDIAVKRSYGSAR